jgi:cytochrome c5
MSDTHEHDAPHEGPIKTPKQLIWTVVASFVIPIVVIIMLANFVMMGGKTGAGSDGMTPEAVARRIQPVGSIEIKDPNNVAAMKTGEQVFQAQCSACHVSGAAGAPKIGDEAAWGPRIKTGADALMTAVLKGKGAMGAQGGGDFSDFEINRAMVYVVNKSGGKFDEPKAPAAAASAPK